MRLKIFFAVAAAVAISSCIKQEKPSSEADITGFTISSSADITTSDLAPNEVILKISEKDWASLVDADEPFTPSITLSAGAMVEPPSGTPIRLSQAKYVVMAQDGVSRKEYTVLAIKEYTGDTLYFSFDDWKIKEGDGYTYLSDVSWSNGNPGVSMGILLMGRPPVDSSYPSQSSSEAISGKAIRLETKQGGIIMGMQVPVWAGNFFLGNFNTQKVLDPLKATEFGRYTRRKPQSVQGFYKYKEGSGKFNDHTELVDRADSCSIYAVFYRADADDGSEVTLDAYDISTSPYIVARADLQDGSATAGDGFHEFRCDFRYRNNAEEPDFDKHRYKLTVVFSSSGIGATIRNGQHVYLGKVGSVLLVDEVKVVNFPKSS